MLQPFRQRRSFFYAFCVLILLGLGATDSSAQGPTFLRVLAGASPAGDSTGAGNESRFNVPSAVAVDGSGTLYVADTGNCRIKKVTAAGVVTDLAGGESGCGSADGPGDVAKFSNPSRVAVDNTGTVRHGYVQSRSEDYPAGVEHAGGSSEASERRRHGSRAILRPSRDSR